MDRTKNNESSNDKETSESVVKPLIGKANNASNQSDETKDIKKFQRNSVPPHTHGKPADVEYRFVPPDGGWGWLVLLGATLVNILIPGTIKSFGVLFVEFLEAFEASPSTAAWIPALCYFLYSSLGPISSILSVKYSYRTVTLIGGTLAAVGMMLSFFASSVPFLYVSYGVLVGAGAGLTFPPTVYIVTSYFVRLRGLANGLCISGSAFGSIILPPILRILLEAYGYRGSVLIMGAITLNTWVAALFYEPVEHHMIREVVNKKELEDIPEEEEEDTGIMMKIEQGDNDSKVEPSLYLSDEALESSKPLNITSPELYKYLPGDNDFGRSVSAAVVQSVKDEHGNNRMRKISTPVKMPQRNHTFSTSGGNPLSSTPSLYAVPEGAQSSHRLSRLSMRRNSKSHLANKRSPSISSFQYISTPYHGSTLSFQPEQFASHLSLKSIGSAGKHMSRLEECSKEEEDEDEKKQESIRSKFFDLTLLKDAAYLVLLISNSTNAISYTNFIILLPTYAQELGFDKDLAAYLISIVSTLDLVGRIGGAALSDIGLIPKTWYFVGGLAISGFALSILPLAQSYVMVSCCCAVFGLASGVYVGIFSVIMADMLGTERLTSSYGISLFVNGVLQLIGPPLCGLWFQSVHSYAPLFTTLGITLMGGASLWFCMPFIERSRKRKSEILKLNDAEKDAPNGRL